MEQTARIQPKAPEDLGEVVSELLEQGGFLVTSENGTGPQAFIKMLKDYYTGLAGAYTAKGMALEARVFAEVAEDFKKMETRLMEATKPLERK